MKPTSTHHNKLVRNLYRSLMKAANPFTVGDAGESGKAAALNCLFHRTGVDESLRGILTKISVEGGFYEDIDEDLFLSEKEESEIIFQKLLRELVAGDNKDGLRMMQFPCHINSCSKYGNSLREIIKREFRDSSLSISSSYNNKIRQQLAFNALREINKKLAWMDQLENKAAKRHRHPQQSAKHVYPVPLRPESYLVPGMYLIAHPNLTGYFWRSVICILDHREEGEEFVLPGRKTKTKGTYGLVVNRICVSPDSGNNMTLDEVMKPIPPKLIDSFGSTLVKEGGPVQMSLQMVSTSPKDKEALDIGGTYIPFHSNENVSSECNNGLNTFYNGDFLKAAEAVASGKLDRDDVSFFVGATCWMPGQLESEIERGFWLPCRGPLEIARSGNCTHESVTEINGNSRPRADLWLSMLSAYGEDEAHLAHLLVDDDGHSELGKACDECD